MSTTKLRFAVIIESDGNRDLNARDWDRIAKRIQRAAKGRSKLRKVFVEPLASMLT